MTPRNTHTAHTPTSLPETRIPIIGPHLHASPGHTVTSQKHNRAQLYAQPRILFKRIHTECAGYQKPQKEQSELSACAQQGRGHFLLKFEIKIVLYACEATRKMGVCAARSGWGQSNGGKGRCLEPIRFSLTHT